jgi:ribosomal protein S18 acetylase RimI-like enzyme
VKPAINLKYKKQNDDIPYDLLLLADESVESINCYIHQCDVYVCLLDDEAIGAYALQVLDDSSVEIMNIAVIPKEQNKGIGSQILQHIISTSKDSGYQNILVGTADAGIMQLYFYQKNGFEIDSIKKNYFINKFNEPIFENNIQLRHMIMLKKSIIQYPQV